MRLRLGDRDRVQQPEVARLVTHGSPSRLQGRGGACPPIQLRVDPAVKTVVPYRQRVNAKSGLPWEPQELAAAARRNLTAGTATYFETTAVFPPSAENEAAWAEWRFVPRVGRDVGSVSTEVEILGVKMCAPILLAPCAYTGRAHTGGELTVGAGRTGDRHDLCGAGDEHEGAARRRPERARPLLVPALRAERRRRARTVARRRGRRRFRRDRRDARRAGRFDPPLRVPARPRHGRPDGTRPSRRVAAQSVGDVEDHRAHFRAIADPGSREGRAAARRRARRGVARRGRHHRVEPRRSPARRRRPDRAGAREDRRGRRARAGTRRRRHPLGSRRVAPRCASARRGC